ncbi:MAG: tyrosine-type recombinase/integrase [Deltaproteobacteria bacterium]|nr:tyrosine-type recombinase/integrase [Deltaproteobacteria bacterium]
MLAKRKVEICSGTFLPEKRQTDLTMDGLRKVWLEEAASKASIGDDRQRLATIVDHFGATTRVASLLPVDVAKFANTLAQRKTRRGSLMAQATINRHLAVLIWALRAAERNGYRHRLPAASITLKPENNERNRICSADEYSKLIDWAQPQLRLAIIIAYHTGMRLGEIASLTWDRVNTRSKLVHLKASDTKTGAARTIPLAKPVIEELKARPRRLDGTLIQRCGDDAVIGLLAVVQVDRDRRLALSRHAALGAHELSPRRHGSRHHQAHQRSQDLADVRTIPNGHRLRLSRCDGRGRSIRP